MPFFADRVKETTATTGTGSIVVNGAVNGFQSFTAAGADGQTLDYAIQDGFNWETGQGAYTAGTLTLTRATVHASSNAGAKINLSGAAVVWIDLSANELNRGSIGGVLKRSYANENITIENNHQAVGVGRLTLTGTSRLSLNGTARIALL